MTSVLITPGPVTTVTLNRPDVRNAFDERLIEDLTTWAASVPADGSVRVVVLQGAGSVFSAGADVQWMSKMLGYSREENIADATRAARMFHAIDAIPVPVIGRIHGAALGGGSGLAAVCDVVVAAEDAIFGFTEVVLGILPGMISPFVVRKIGLSAARELCLSGARFSAARARGDRSRPRCGRGRAIGPRGRAPCTALPQGGAFRGRGDQGTPQRRPWPSAG